MKKLSKIIYIIRMLLFVINFYFIFIMLENILDTKVFGIIFLVFYMILVIKVFIELLIKKDLCKDIIYNIMQTGVYLYILVMSIKMIVYNIHVTKITYEYFKTNYLILSVLIVFVLIYSYLEFKSSNKWWLL